jgi:hypothetical protein
VQHALPGVGENFQDHYELVKAGEAEVKPRFAQLANFFEREHLEIPAGVERQLVVGEHIGAALRRREVRQDDARHLVEAEQMRGERPAVACARASRAPGRGAGRLMGAKMRESLPF